MSPLSHSLSLSLREFHATQDAQVAVLLVATEISLAMRLEGRRRDSGERGEGGGRGLKKMMGEEGG